MDASYYQDLIAPIYRRRWIITLDVLALATSAVRWLRSIDAPPPFVIAGTHGTGELPSPEEAEWAILHTGGHGVMGTIRAFADALGDLPGHVVDRIDSWDPERTAGVLGGYLASHSHVAGRRMYGARPPEWEALEDKTTVNEIWSAADVPAAPYEVVASQPEALATAAARLDRGAGTVWVADNKEGLHGGGEYLRWVTDAATRTEATTFLQSHSDTARIMPFLEGMSCSIHGIVFDDSVITFRPVEAITMRDEQARLRYSGMSSFWDAPEAAVADMRASARRVGEHLRTLVDYRGIFTMDGVLCDEGFRPTELNPRPGAGIGPATAGAGDLGIIALTRAVIEREDLDFRPADLERLVLEGWRLKRSGGGHLTIEAAPESEHEQPVTFDGDRCLPTDDEADDVMGVLEWGDGPYGGLLRLQAESGKISFGPPMAPKTAAAFGLADDLWGTGVGPLEPTFGLRGKGGGEGRLGG